MFFCRIFRFMILKFFFGFKIFLNYEYIFIGEEQRKEEVLKMVGDSEGFWRRNGFNFEDWERNRGEVFLGKRKGGRKY